MCLKNPKPTLVSALVVTPLIGFSGQIQESRFKVLEVSHDKEIETAAERRTAHGPTSPIGANTQSRSTGSME